LALVGLSSLAAIEAGGCDKKPESLRSLSRSALPLLAQATGSNSTEINYSLADYGLGPRPGVQHVCGHYDLRADGRLTTWDLFVSHDEPNQLRDAVDADLVSAKRQRPQRSEPVQISVKSLASFEWPAHCPKYANANARSVLLATRVL
jgi:hypothetical protein